MENTQNKTTEEPKAEKLEVQNIEPAGENLSEAELDRVAGGNVAAKWSVAQNASA